MDCNERVAPWLSGLCICLKRERSLVWSWEESQSHLGWCQKGTRCRKQMNSKIKHFGDPLMNEGVDESILSKINDTSVIETINPSGKCSLRSRSNEAKGSFSYRSLQSQTAFCNLKCRPLLAITANGTSRHFCIDFTSQTHKIPAFCLTVRYQLYVSQFLTQYVVVVHKISAKTLMWSRGTVVLRAKTLSSLFTVYTNIQTNSFQWRAAGQKHQWPRPSWSYPPQTPWMFIQSCMENFISVTNNW